MPTLPSGARIGDYEILGLIGAGGMGAVYRARSAGGRVVALKVILPEHARKARFVERFRRECLALASCQHENVATFFDSGEAGGHLFLASELVPGGSLKERL